MNQKISTALGPVLGLVLGMILSLLSPLPAAHAAKFANQFVEFEVPPQWVCQLEGAEWVCQNTNESKKRDAIIVLAAKLKGDQDSLDQYLAYLKNPKTYLSIQGKQMKSEPRYAKTASINTHPWVDSLHLESEIPGFFTRYLATVKQDIGVLVTYSIAKNKYQDYLSDFENFVKTLKVFRKPGGINAGAAAGNIFQNTTVPQNISEGTIFPGAAPIGGSDEKKPKAKDDDGTLLLLLAGAGVVGFIIWRRKRQQSGG